MTISDTLSASLEDYLEAIYQIILEKKAVRPRDIAKKLNITYPSVTGALKLLAEKNLINYTPYDFISLTQTGEAIAKDVARRHEILRDFFIEVLAVPYEEADDAACKMEHSIPKELVERFIQFVEFVRICPRGGDKWIKGFAYKCDNEGAMDNCESCILACLDDLKKTQKQKNNNTKNAVTLKDLKPGQRSRVLKIFAKGDIKKRLLDMGITFGAVIELERIAPLGDPIEIKIRGYHLSLRKEEAEGIEVEII
ncbi:MAG TPA: DtxR family transcriptional regulator [Syntrophorhabdaceae bacterium]|nr:DtxR family transcriptional regulator [Syntrophorhabdaceae bacterium]